MISRREPKEGTFLGTGVTRNLQVVAEAATGAVQRWIQLNDEAYGAHNEERGTHRVAEEALRWVEGGPAALRESQRRDNGGNVGTGQQPVGRTRAATAAQAGGRAETVGSERSG